MKNGRIIHTPEITVMMPNAVNSTDHELYYITMEQLPCKTEPTDPIPPITPLIAATGACTASQ